MVYHTDKILSANQSSDSPEYKPFCISCSMVSFYTFKTLKPSVTLFFQIQTFSDMFDIILFFFYLQRSPDSRKGSVQPIARMQREQTRRLIISIFSQDAFLSNLYSIFTLYHFFMDFLTNFE